MEFNFYTIFPDLVSFLILINEIGGGSTWICTAQAYQHLL